MSAPTSNNLEGFIPDEKHTPVHIRHRDVGPHRPSNPELKDIFDHPADFVAEDTVSPEQAFNELDKALNSETPHATSPTITSEIQVRPGTALDRSLHIPKKPENTMEVPNNDQLLSFFDNKNRKSLKETRLERERGRGQGPQQEETTPTVFQKTKNQISDFANVLLRNKQGEEKSKILGFRTELSSVPESKGLEGFTEIIQKGLHDQIISPTQADFLLEQLSREKVVEEKISVKESRNEVLPWSNQGGKLFYYLGSKSNSTSEQGKAFKSLQFAIDHLQTAGEVRSVLETYKDRISEDEFKKISAMVGTLSTSLHVDIQPEKPEDTHVFEQPSVKATTRTISQEDIDTFNQSRPQPITEIPAAVISEIKSQTEVEPTQKVETTPPPLPQWYIEQEDAARKERAAQRNVEKVWSAIERVEAWSPGHTFTINALGKRVSLVEGLTPEECQAAFGELARQGKLVASGNEYRVKMMESEDDEGIVAPAAEGEKETPEVTGTQEMPIFKPESAEASPDEVAKVWDSIKSHKYASPFITRPDGPHSSVVGVPSNEVVQAAFEELVKQGKLQPTSSRGMYSVIQNNPVPFEPALMASEEAIEDFKPITSDADREQGFKWEILNKIDKQVYENKLKKQQELEKQAESFVNAELPTHDEMVQSEVNNDGHVVIPESQSMPAGYAEESEHAYATEAKGDNERILTEQEEKELIELDRQAKQKAETGEVTPPSLETALRGRMETARDAHLAATIEHKKVLAEKKGIFKNLMLKLGAGDKQMPVNENDQTFIHLKQAEEAHLKAKMELHRNITGRTEIGPVTKEEDKRINKKLIDEMEKQDAIWQKKLMEATPPKERGRLAQSIKDWNGLPIWARVAISQAVIMGFAASTDALAKQFDIHVPGISNHAITLGTGGYRLVRAGAGALASKAVGKYMDSAYNKKAEQRKQKATTEYLDAYQSDLSVEALMQKEHERQEYFIKEENIKKKNLVYKALAMMGVGAGVTTGIGVGMQEVSSALDHAHAVAPIDISTLKGTPIQPEVPHVQPVMTEHGLAVPHDTLSATPEVHTGPAVSVELSPKGFIDTFAQLKEQVKLKYPDITAAPADVQEMMKLSPTQLAEKFGLYKPGETFQSAVGLKGDHLTFDTKGDLVLEQKSASQMLFDAHAGKINFYKGSMLDANTGKVGGGPITEATPAPHTPEVAVSEQEPVSSHYIPDSLVQESWKEAGVSKLGFINPHQSDLAVDAALVASAAFDEAMKTPAQVEFSKDMTWEDILSNKVCLPAQYQFSPQFKAERKAYNIAFEKSLINLPLGEITNRLPIDYMGGRIQVIQKGDEFVGLLNGEKIGTGKLINGGIGWKYEDALGKGGLFGVKSPYEDAFEKMKQVVDKKKDIFTIARV